MLLTVHELTKADIPAVAHLMNRIKPEWWTVEQGTRQLSSSIGWFMTGADGQPVGWLSAIHMPLLRALEIDTLAFAAETGPKVGPELDPLLAACEAWGRANDIANIRFIIGSQYSCQGRRLGEPWQELRDLVPPESNRQIPWWYGHGYKPTAVLPEVFGPGHHGIMLLKHLG